MFDRQLIVPSCVLLLGAVMTQAESRQWRPDELITLRIQKRPPDTAHDLDLPGGQTQGGDAQHRRQQQALDGRSSETPPIIPGAPTPPRTAEPAGPASGRM